MNKVDVALAEQFSRLEDAELSFPDNFDQLLDLPGTADLRLDLPELDFGLPDYGNNFLCFMDFVLISDFRILAVFELCSTNYCHSVLHHSVLVVVPFL